MHQLAPWSKLLIQIIIK